MKVGLLPRFESNQPRTLAGKAKRSIRSAGVGLLLATGILWAWSCGDGAVQPIAPPARPDSVVVTPESAGLATPGDTVRLRAGVRDQNGFELPGVGVTWTSSAPGIATVDTSGVVTAAGVGSATITATATAAEVHSSAVVSVAPSNSDWSLVVWSYPCFPENGDTPPCEGGDVGGLGPPRGWTSAMRVFSCFKLPDRDCGEWRGWGRSYSVSDPSVLAPWRDICTFHWRCPAYAGRRVGSTTVTVTATRDSDRTTRTASVTFTVQSLDHPTMKAVHSGLGSPSWPGWGQDTLHLREWKGVYASWLGKVSSLSLYEPSADAGPIPIPPSIGDLDALTRLQVEGPAFSGSIPPWLGGLAKLMVLRVSGAEYSGSIPPALGGLANLQTLDLSGNQLSGSIPPALGSLSNLQALILNNNDLTGEIPVELVNLTNLRRLDLRGNKLCEPADSAFRAWADSLQTYYHLPRCSPTFAEVFQVTQQPGLHGREDGGFIAAPAALLAGRNAVLRVAPLAEEGSGDRVTRQVRVRYRGSGGVEVKLIPEGPYDKDLPSRVNFSSLDSTFNLVIPATDVQRPDLEIWVEVWRTLSSGATTADTIYKKVPVRAVPVLELTLVPVLHADPRSDPVALADWERLDAFANDVARVGVHHDALKSVRDLLPVVQVKVTAGRGVWTDKWNSDGILSAVEVYVTESAKTTAVRGHVMGIVANPPIDGLGYAGIGGSTSMSVVFDGGTLHKEYRETMAHELGHNLGLYHAPCSPPKVKIEKVDKGFPHDRARIGSWGYDAGKLVPNTHHDLMSYCNPQWISHYNFRNVFNWRSVYADRAAPVVSAATGKVLLLWGGTRTDGSLHLKPAFVLDGAPRLPDTGGAYEITGLGTGGEALFSLSFAMTEVADGPGGVSRFRFAVPVRSEWEGRLASIHLRGPGGVSRFRFAVPVRSEWEGRLASIHLRGPGGSVTLDADSDSPMALVTDPVTGELRAILYDVTPTEAAEFSVVRTGANPQVHFSRGLPDELRRRR